MGGVMCASIESIYIQIKLHASTRNKVFASLSRLVHWTLRASGPPLSPGCLAIFGVPTRLPTKYPRSVFTSSRAHVYMEDYT